MTDVKQMARDLLAFYGGDEKRWTRGHCARDASGEMTNARGNDAVCWCLMGALIALGVERAADQNAFSAALLESRDELPSFNDAARSFAEVEAALKRIAEAP